MKLFSSLVFISSIGIVLVVASDTPKDNEASKADTNAENEETKDGNQKRFFGNVLSSGFKMGKKDQGNEENDLAEGLKQELKRWYFGSLLGKGFKAGKRASFDIGDESVGREIEEADLDGPVDDKRWSGLGNMYGKGYFLPNGRFKRSADKRFIHYFGRGLILGERDRKDTGVNNLQRDELENDNNGEQVNMEDYDGFIGNDFNPELEAAKRYIGTNPGQRFKFGFGKRTPDIFEVPESDIDYIEGLPYEKRGFGLVLGRGFSFGKRTQNKRRPFGYVLGRGLSFGKRSSDDVITPKIEAEIANLYASQYGDNEMQKRMGLVLGRGFLMGKRGSGSKRFGSILGKGLKFGKRSEAVLPYEVIPVSSDNILDDEGLPGEYYEPSYEKRRFGHVLGSGFALGKRNQELDFDSIPDKRGFGFMLGRGFRLGKR